MKYIATMQDVTIQSGQASFVGSQEIAQRIRSARARAGFTRKQLAAASGASERYLAHLEAGTGNPSVEMLLAISEALGMAMAELLPMGGERDAGVAHAAQLLRRAPPERVREALAWLGERPDAVDGKGRRVALIGLRGAGKSSLGQALADRLSVPFFEISKEVEQRYGGSIGVLLEINGPAALRRYEADVLRDICRTNAAAVIAAPGAVVADGKLFDQLLRETWTVWLQATPEDHMSRVVAQGDLRPMTGNRTAMNDLKAILAAREADYARADARLDTSGQDFNHTVSMLEGVVASFAG
ncbi:shikimate kinase [Alteraurantiacibacter buctensis]|uniref:Shikimate kinase n=1 Tax=Alteraurantiacibacter buctensis TaxID=1503981 RepID=A0A844YZM3_9SPHN|nr:shikimate kinase [Alteraurantiacibacter buctensis]MXO73009.1 helix-turn-helix domain-containing protein [Alteraurantiacibacter buctensis]